MSKIPDDLIGAGDAAKLANCHRDTIINWANRGHLKYYRLPSGMFRVSRAAVLELLANSAGTPSTD